MPSLRRSVSSPVVHARSSPYPTLSSSNSGPATRPGHSHRRSSGSETATRRVLADIEWWRVSEGQRDLEAVEAEEDSSEPSSPRTPENLLEGLVSPAWPGFSEFLPEVLTVIPQTPPRRGHRLESSTSSLESTPESSDGPMEGLRLGLQYVSLGPSDASLPPAHSNEQAFAFTLLSRSRSFVNQSNSDVQRDFDYPVFAVSSLSHSPEICN
ncbi:hypothetical protein BDP27DRAFT_1433897 [Rhodocollybia butyracea]|uniref:Uncharacterized protein n=1 Tax=Rhodocollybia butyracea TaxID=206335 RepID=A0A9P5TX80_9AGAR|nr:hypothetical protein BDP27DRAFT_1433897 [Rhodocollybia butyracea]